MHSAVTEIWRSTHSACAHVLLSRFASSLFAGMRADMCEGVRVDARVRTRTHVDMCAADMCVHMCADICADIFVHMDADVCVGMRKACKCPYTRAESSEK